MKSISRFAIAVIFFFSLSCGSGNTEKSEQYTGMIEAAGITSYQYGTHILETSNDEFYALKSDSVNLAEYEGKRITITASKIEGYPVDGGPVYLHVNAVKE